MASPTSSNDNSPSKETPNRYFFYGTHPVKVTNSLIHSNSTSEILTSTANSNTHFLSLNLTNNHTRLSPTSCSLKDFSQKCQDSDDVNDEMFEDAVESLENDHKQTNMNNNSNHRRHSSMKQHDMLTIDLSQVFNECTEINRLFFENHLNEALKKSKEQENRSFYHSLCHSVIRYLYAAMTFNPDDVEASIQALKHTISMTKKYETYRSWVPFNLLTKPAVTEHELHAKLVYAEALLIRAYLTFIQDQSLYSLISGALKIKECHDIFVKLAKQNDPSRFSTVESHEHFDSGVRLGNGSFNLLISNLPQRIIRYLEFAGFTGHRGSGLLELQKSATSNGLRSLFSSLLILSFHAFVTQTFGNADGDLQTCDMLIERFLKLYPNSYMFLFFRARLQTIRCQLDEAISTHRYAMECQQDWKDLHHLAYWELTWSYALQRDWKQASICAKTLLDENNWSKATYCYLLATFIMEENNGIPTDEVINLYKLVPERKTRFAGKSIPLEKYAIRKCEHFLAQQWLFLPALELIYLMNGFYILAHDSIKLNETFDNVKNALNDLEQNHKNDRYYIDSYGSGLLITGVLLQFLRRYDEAHEALDHVLQLTKKFDHKSFLPATALLEKALIYLNLKQKQRAIEYFHKALNDHKDYLLESRVQFRINSGMLAAKQLDN